MGKRKTLTERAAEARDELDWINAQLSAETLTRAIRQRDARSGLIAAEGAVETLQELIARWELEMVAHQASKGDE